jgi:glucose-specific phosphotransferase system IIA component
MRIDYVAPIQGEHLDVSVAPDDTFSQGLLGPGFVILPSDRKIYAPFDGIISLLFPTYHALAIHHASGINCLIHIGFGTVDLKGEGFTVYKKLHDEVKQGDLLLEFDFDFLSQHAISMATPIVFLQKQKLDILSRNDNHSRVHMILEVT